ncbi:retrovirus-related pol polyprotein from transposon TNT 1-94, partial [Tanacetum coccineum]
CTPAKAIWTDLILTHEGPSNTRDTKIASLKLKSNAFKAIDGKKVNGTFTRLKYLLNDLENNGVSNPQVEVNATFVNSLPRKWLKTSRFTIQTSSSKAFISNPQVQDSDFDVKEDQRSNSEFLGDLNIEFHEKALLANQKRFYKRPGRVGLAKKPMGLVAESFDWDEESVSRKDKGVTMVKAFMAITKDEPSIGKADAGLGQCVEITMKKVQRLLSMTDGEERKHVLDYTHVDLHYVEDRRKNLLNKFNTLKQEVSSLNGNIVRALGGRGKKKEKKYSKEVVFTKGDISPSKASTNVTFDNKSEDDNQEPLPPFRKLSRDEPISTSKDVTSLVVLVQAAIVSNKTKFNDHYPGCNICGSIAHELADYDKKTASSRKPRVSFQRSYEPTEKMENLNEVRVKELKSDNGTKFRNQKLEEFCDEKGISQKNSSSCTHEQNGVAERRNQTLIEAAKSILNSSKLPKLFWGEAVNTACYTQNKSIIMKRHRKTAYDVFRGRSPDISYFQTFECPVFIYNHRDHLGKFDERLMMASFLATLHWQKPLEGDQINFNENISFPDDEFLEPRSMISQKTGNDDSFTYINIPPADSPKMPIVVGNIIGELITGVTTRSRIRDSEATPVHKCLYVNFLSKIEPKKLTEALEEEGWIIAMQEELNQFERNKSIAYAIMDYAAKIFLAYAAYMGSMVYQMDVKSAFLNALYGLKQAPKHASKPNIQFSICLYARYQANPKESHLVAVKRIFRKSTSGGCQILGEKLVCWSAKKQSSVAMSSAEAEYVDAAGCCAQVLWIKSQLADYDVLYDKVPIFCDNTSAIAISNNPVLHSRTKHIDIRYHFIRDHILKGDIKLHFVPTDLQLADIFTKPLAKPSFTRLVVELGMLNIKKEVSDKKKALSDPLT